MDPISKHEDRNEEFLRNLTFPEEDRPLFTSTPWRGGFRWFRSANILPLERWRSQQRSGAPPTKPTTGSERET
jgi:hypothetical protein